MKKLSVLAVAGVVGLALSAWAADGAALFKSKMCGACHGAGKKGGDLSKCAAKDKAAIVKFLKDPKAKDPKSTMPPIKGTDEELNALADYVLSLCK